MKEVALFLAEGFEEIEAITVVDILRRADVSVRVVSLTGELTVSGSHKISILADCLFEKCDFITTDMLILPGGMPGTNGLDAHLGLRELLLNFAKQEKYLAAICAAPLVLGNLGLLKNKRATCYPGFENHLVGALLQEVKVVRDGMFITSKGPGTAIPFALKIVETLLGQKKVDELSHAMIIKN